MQSTRLYLLSLLDDGHHTTRAAASGTFSPCHLASVRIIKWPVVAREKKMPKYFLTLKALESVHVLFLLVFIQFCLLYEFSW